MLPIWSRWSARPSSLPQVASGVLIDVSRVSQLDTFGAWFIERMRRSYAAGRRRAQVMGLSETYSPLVDEVSRVQKPDGDRAFAPVDPWVRSTGSAARSSVSITISALRFTASWR